MLFYKLDEEPNINLSRIHRVTFTKTLNVQQLEVYF